MRFERAEELLEAIKRVRVLVVGDLMLDRYVSGSAQRISPEAPVPVVLVEDERAGLGGAANVAANVAALGGRSVVVGCVGDDEPGQEVLRSLETAGISTEGVVVTPDRPTTVKTRIMAAHQQVARFDREDPTDVPPEVESALADAVRGFSVNADVVVVEDYNKGVLTAALIGTVLEVAAARGIPSVVDPKRRNFFAYAGATVFKPNTRELEEALGAPLRADDDEWMERTRVRLGCENLLLTRGDQGIALQSHASGYTRIPAVARSEFDVSGAGDTVAAVVAGVIAAGGAAREAAELANHAAAVEVAKTGVATVSADELLAQLQSKSA